MTEQGFRLQISINPVYMRLLKNVALFDYDFYSSDRLMQAKCGKKRVSINRQLTKLYKKRLVDKKRDGNKTFYNVTEKGYNILKKYKILEENKLIQEKIIKELLVLEKTKEWEKS